MASLMIVHRSGTRNDEVLLNRDHILFATRRTTTQQGEHTEITLNHSVTGIGQTLAVTEDLGALIAGLSSGPTLRS